MFLHCLVFAVMINFMYSSLLIGGKIAFYWKSINNKRVVLISNEKINVDSANHYNRWYAFRYTMLNNVWCKMKEKQLLTLVPFCFHQYVIFILNFKCLVMSNFVSPKFWHIYNGIILNSWKIYNNPNLTILWWIYTND